MVAAIIAIFIIGNFLLPMWVSEIGNISFNSIIAKDKSSLKRIL